MKHYYFLSAAALLAFSAHAEVTVTTSTVDEDTQLMGESMSPNAKFVVGTNFSGYIPCAWDVTNNQYYNFADFEEGQFHTVSDDGFVVGAAPTEPGSQYVHAIAGNVSGEVSFLWYNEGELLYNEEWDFWYTTGDAGSDAYCMTADHQTIFGFYYDSMYATTPCYWRDGQRYDLPVPTDEEAGFYVNGAEVRWCTPDGSLLLGYAIDDLGTWPACLWRLQADGTYACDPICNQYFEINYGDGKPYMLFTPYGLSQNGEWISLSIQEEFDFFGGADEPSIQIARLHLTDGTLEVLDADFGSTTTPSDIANDGTLGIITDALGGMVGREAYLWQGGETEAVTLEEVTGPIAEFEDLLCNTLCTLSGDGKYLQGFAMLNNEEADIFSYIIDLGDVVSLRALKQLSATQAIYSLQGQRLQSLAAPGLYLVGGQKQLRK